MKIVGISGQMAYGKDELADCLIEIYKNKKNINWIKRGMAVPVKETFCKMFNVDMDFIERWKRNPDPPPGFKKNVRDSLQFVGDGARSIDPYVWIKQMVKFSEENSEKNIFVPDCRYFNEAELIKKRNGFTILVYRPGYLNDNKNESESQIRKVLDWIISNDFKEGKIDLQRMSLYHSYPKEILFYDYFILNDSSLEDYRLKIEKDVFPLIS
jgi:hypothetical protein